MRLHITVKPAMIGCSITLNYGYYLSAAIYRWIELSSPEYSAFLHNHGFPLEGAVRQFRHFCFSRLVVHERTILNGRLHIGSPVVDWYVAMPVESSLQHLVVGMFEKREFYIEREESKFVIEQVEALAEPPWQRIMKFRLLSPLTVSVPEGRGGRLIPHYLRPDDLGLGEALRTNILNKYRSLCGSQPEDQAFNCKLDEKFIAERGGPDRISKLITIKEGRDDETRVRGFMCPLTIEGNPELIRLAYESGLGEKGSLGFGMLEVM